MHAKLHMNPAVNAIRPLRRATSSLRSAVAALETELASRRLREDERFRRLRLRDDETARQLEDVASELERLAADGLQAQCTK